MICITLLLIVNLAMYLVFVDQAILYVIGIIDLLLSTVLFIDFVRRFVMAENKMNYMLKDYGWADLLASFPLPQIKILRIFRLVKAYALMKRRGFRQVARDIREQLPSSALYLVFFMILLLLEFGSIAVLFTERTSSEANIKSASDAIWWVYVTITTVGYGDKFPTTNGGRLIGVFVMLVGVGLFGVITGYLANKFLPSSDTVSQETIDPGAIEDMRAEMKEMKSMIAKLSDTDKK